MLPFFLQFYILFPSLLNRVVKSVEEGVRGEGGGGRKGAGGVSDGGSGFPLGQFYPQRYVDTWTNEQ